MKLIEECITSENWKTIITCPRCLCKYEVTWKDITLSQEKKETFLGFKRVLVYTVKCKCGKTIKLNSEDISSVVKEKVWEYMDPTEKILKFYFGYHE